MHTPKEKAVKRVSFGSAWPDRSEYVAFFFLFAYTGPPGPNRKTGFRVVRLSSTGEPT